MAQSRIVLICMVALVLALGAAFVARGLAAPKRRAVAQAVAPPKPTLKVLVAKRDLAVGDVIGPDSFTWQPWPADGLNPRFIIQGGPIVPAAGADGKLVDAAKSAADAAKTAVTGDLGPSAALMGSVVREAMAANEPVLASKLVKGGAGGVMAVTLDPGMRAMSVPITAESAAGGFILPGDHVDVVQARKLTPPGGGDMTVATTAVLKNVRVLAIDQNTHPLEKASAQIGATGTLEVTPDQAELLIRSRAQGDLTLMLRSYADAQGPTTEGAARRATADGMVHVFRSGQSTDIKVTR